MFNVDGNKCTGCEKCVDVCPQRAISMVNGKAVIDGNRCTDCGACAQVCPQGAISSVIRSRQNIPPVQGQDFPGVGMGSGGGMGRGMGKKGYRQRTGKRSS